MRIVIDARLIETSTGRYMQRLVEGLNDEYTSVDNHEYVVLLPSPHASKWQQRLANMKVVAADQKWYSFSEQWSLYWLLRRLRPDLVHFTMPNQPILWTGPAITTIHDVTLIRFDNIRKDDSKLVYWIRKKIFLGMLHIVIRRSKAILTPTEFVRQDLGDYFGRKHLTKIYTTLLAGEIPNVDYEPIEGYEGKEFIFFVGNSFPYKNIWRIVDAFSRIRDTRPSLHLLLAGKKDAFYQELEEKVIKHGIPDVHFLGFISDGEKRWAFRNAKAFVTASYSEGFCMPVLEAMVESTPVVSSSASCLPEVVGDGGVLFDPDSTEDLVNKLIPVLDDESLRQELIARSKKHVAKFSWKKTIGETRAVYLRVLGQ